MMDFTRDDVIQYVESEDVKFIRLAFCDKQGRQKNMAIMPEELPLAFEEGFPLESSVLEGLPEGKLLLRPDPATLIQLPWRPQHGKVVHMFCDLLLPDGSPFEEDPRRQLKLAAESQGGGLLLSALMEFTLFRLDDRGLPTEEPCDYAGYLDIAPEDRGENVRRAICLTLEQMGIQPKGSLHAKGPGQNLILLRPAAPLTAADHMVTFRTVVRTIAAQNGFYADFSCPANRTVLVLYRNGREERRPVEGAEQNPYTLVKQVLRG